MDVVARRHRFGMVEAACGDVDLIGMIIGLKRDLGPAMGTEAAGCLPARAEARRMPCSNRNSDCLTLNRATNGAPVVRRHIEQWQLVSSNGRPATS
jgi:hypothetical protein